MINNKKVLGTLGLAMKSGHVVSGEFMTEKAIRDGSARLVIVAGDASDNTKKKFSDSCKFYKVAYALFGDKDMLGNAIGKQFRASLAVTDKGFAASIGKNLNLEVTKYGKNENI
jgi:ribosomal protein L7Ae-like RNA K-turn-binding protein